MPKSMQPTEAEFADARRFVADQIQIMMNRGHAPRFTTFSEVDALVLAVVTPLARVRRYAEMENARVAGRAKTKINTAMRDREFFERLYQLIAATPRPTIERQCRATSLGVRCQRNIWHDGDHEFIGDDETMTEQALKAEFPQSEQAFVGGERGGKTARLGTLGPEPEHRPYELHEHYGSQDAAAVVLDYVHRRLDELGKAIDELKLMVSDAPRPSPVPTETAAERPTAAPTSIPIAD